MLHTSKLWPYPEILDQSGKDLQGLKLQLSTKIRKFRSLKALLHQSQVGSRDGSKQFDIFNFTFDVGCF